MTAPDLLERQLDAHRKMLDYWQGLVNEVSKEYEESRIEQIKKAILNSSNHTWKQIRSSRQDKSTTYCRIVFAYHCDRYGIKNDRISQELNRHKSTTTYYPVDYKSIGEPQFKNLAEQVKKLLNK